MQVDGRAPTGGGLTAAMSAKSGKGISSFVHPHQGARGRGSPDLLKKVETGRCPVVGFMLVCGGGGGGAVGHSHLHPPPRLLALDI